MEINGIDITEYKNHPRVLEIRFILLFDLFEKEYGYSGAVSIFEAICGSMNCNMRFLLDIINKRFEIKRQSKTKFTRWRQEVIFASYLYGETTYKVANDYLHVAPSSLYMQKEIYGMNNFITRSWLLELDKEIELSGLKHYRVEIERFFIVIENLTNVLVKWKGGK